MTDHRAASDAIADLDAALAAEPTQGPTFSGAVGKRCRRHEWVWTPFLQPSVSEPTVYGCAHCGTLRDEAKARRGKSATRQGKDAERQIASDTGGVRVGHHGGPVDVLAPVPRRFAIQSKRVVAPTAARTEAKRRPTFPEWMWDELRILPATGGDVPALIVSDKPGSGHDRRSLVVLDYRDYVDLYGEVAE